MVDTAALLFGHGAPVFAEEESVVEMIGKYFLQLTSPSRKTSSARRGSVESCDETDNNLPFADVDAGLEHEERLLQQEVTRRIEHCLTEAKASTLHCQMLLLPRQMTTRVGQDVVRSSADEPCGLRGASIKVYVEGKDGLKSVGSILVDQSVTPTFELSVIFKADKDDGWPPLKHIFDTNKVLKLRAEYRLVKRKLYSSASPVIHDFN
ncbi:DNA damage-inducible transcript 4-like protein-like [Plectropomus leopardus]|uniref:DNA damage-inducible transcript 4-like protein-like n=1 Tax=Plectropomus leopardus TaxID=160734 RepID=UPI001C4B9260|nr:DNA damage-inducible transcript 4-like protein-like [Plectropomus leopardus]XP_042349347.1 DNA damage-inducible transcript 4-like protein-like [Plectropomus leopardus]